MSIPCKMRPAGLESLPLGYTRLEFLESTGTQYIDTELQPGIDAAFLLEYGVRSDGVYLEPIDFCSLLGAGRSNSWGGFRVWGYRREYNARATFGDTHYYINQSDFLRERHISEVNFFKSLKIKVNSANFSNEQNIITTETKWPSRNSMFIFGFNSDGTKVLCSCRVFEAVVTKGASIIFSVIPALDTVGRPCMFDLVTRKSFYNQGTGEFIAGLTMGQARNLAYLPAPTTINTLTISLPKEARLVLYNQEVNAAIAAAEAKGWTINVQYRDEFDDVAIRDKYAECVTLRDIININPEYYLDLTSAGEWIYPLPELTSAGQMWQFHPELKAWLVDMPKLTNLGDWCFNCGGLEYIEMDFSHVTSMGRCFCAPLKSIPEGFNPQTRNFDYLLSGSRLGDDGLVEFNEVVNEAVSGYSMLSVQSKNGVKFQLDPRYTLEHLVNGNNCFSANGDPIGGYYGEIHLNLLSLESADRMFLASTDIYHFESPLPKLRTAKNMFFQDWRNRSFSLDKTSALSVCNNIPNWEDGELHEILIGIYEGYKTDQDVLDALALAEEKGWTLTVQWGKIAPPEWTQAQAQATTYSMRQQQSVYAKLGEPTEHPDGTIRPVLDWGHYITNWEENGYQEFASIEEAYEHFNLEMPAED